MIDLRRDCTSLYSRFSFICGSFLCRTVTHNRTIIVSQSLDRCCAKQAYRLGNGMPTAIVARVKGETPHIT
jgi:hypothetical protein